MRNSDTELKALQKHWKDAELLGEGERKFVLLPNLKVSSDGKTKLVAALLQPWANGNGYPTRLYFSERFSNKGNNWNSFNILGSTWHACSWGEVSEDLPWIEIIANHLRPLQ